MAGAWKPEATAAGAGAWKQESTAVGAESTESTAVGAESTESTAVGAESTEQKLWWGLVATRLRLQRGRKRVKPSGVCAQASGG
ncbi:unnamed protein product [Lota lota]